jgi:hypothetical protein
MRHRIGEAVKALRPWANDLVLAARVQRGKNAPAYSRRHPREGMIQDLTVSISVIAAEAPYALYSGAVGGGQHRRPLPAIDRGFSRNRAQFFPH